MADPIIGSPEWLAQQRKQATESNIKTAPVGYRPPAGDTISSSLFTSTPSIIPTTPQVSPPSGVPQISTPPLVATPKEQEASDLTKRLQALQDTLAGKPAFKKEEEKQFDITGKTQLVQDLSAQYNALLAQSKNIPERLQLEATGRGITAGGLEPIQTGELRKLSIASNTIAAQLQAAQGNLQFAQSLVDKSVSDEYAPAEAELDAKTKNLKLIIDSPEYSIQDKNRAQAQADAIENQKNAIADEKQNKKDVLTEVNNYIKNGGSDPNIIAQMKSQKTGTDAAAIVAQTGFGGKTDWKITTIPAGTDEYGNKLTQKVWYNAKTFEIKPFSQGKTTPPETNISPVTQQPTISIDTQQHDTLTSQLKPGEILVKDKQGNVGAISANEFDPNQYTHIDNGQKTVPGTNPSALSTLPPAQRKIAELMAQYKYPLPSSFALRSPFWVKIITAMANYDPSFDISQYNARVRLRTSFTSGVDSQNITSINTVVGHLKTLKDAIDSMSVIRFAPYSERFDPTVTKFEVAKDAVANELTRVFRGTGGATSDIKDWQNTFNKRSTKEALNSAFNTAIDLMGSRLFAMSQKWETGMGKPKDFKILNDKSRKVLQDMGQDVDAIDPVNQ